MTTTSTYQYGGSGVHLQNSGANHVYSTGQGFATGASGSGSNYGYTSGGQLETSTYTTAGYAQPLSHTGYVTKDGTHLSTTGQVLNQTGNTSFVKNNVSYQTNA